MYVLVFNLLHTLAYSCILTNAPHSCHMLRVGSTGVTWDSVIVIGATAISEPIAIGYIGLHTIVQLRIALRI